MPERPRLHLDFASPCTPPPTYSPTTYCSSPISYSPSSPTLRTSTDSVGSPSTPRTPIGQRIVMGAYVSTPQGTMDDLQGSLEVPGIVLTEPPRKATPRLPSPPPKHVVLLAPVSLPIPPSSPSSLSARDTKTFSSLTNEKQPYQFSPTFMAFLQPQPKKNVGAQNLKTIVLLVLLVMGGYHLWSTLQLGDVVEDAFEVL
ncbi:hypothetical protein IAU60_001641 [Kwoniella sp. DSM 27419]